MAPGDVYAHNDPYRGGIHSNDIVMFRPIFAERPRRVLRGHADPRRGPRRRRDRGARRARHRHLRGGPAPPTGEALLGRRAGPRHPAHHRTQQPRPRQGDRRRQGARRGCHRHRPESRRAHGALRLGDAGALRATTRWTTPSARCATSSPRIPPGTYQGSFEIDGDGVEPGREFEVRAAVTVDGDGGIDIDFAGTSPQARGRSTRRSRRRCPASCTRCGASSTRRSP